MRPFKTGALNAASAAGVPIVPVCVSNTSNKVHLNRLNNGLVILDMLPPFYVREYGKDQSRELAAIHRALLEHKIAELVTAFPELHTNVKV